MVHNERKILHSFQYNIGLITSLMSWKSAKALGKEFDISERTAYRYIEILRCHGFKIGYKKLNSHSKYKIEEVPESFKESINSFNQKLESIPSTQERSFHLIEN